MKPPCSAMPFIAAAMRVFAHAVMDVAAGEVVRGVTGCCAAWVRLEWVRSAEPPSRSGSAPRCRRARAARPGASRCFGRSVGKALAHFARACGKGSDRAAARPSSASEATMLAASSTRSARSRRDGRPALRRLAPRAPAHRRECRRASGQPSAARARRPLGAERRAMRLLRALRWARRSRSRCCRRSATDGCALRAPRRSPARSPQGRGRRRGDRQPAASKRTS